ncbi:MAG: thioredoxin family protein [Saprospiraceae bacterium]|nr:thioredoxin family protein [Saprospiraceae bacterium]MBK8848872.1 thioredoxin family protein [Saprospiraceae bacterium]
MRAIIFILGLLSIQLPINAQGIKFEETTWKLALEKAKSSDKPLFVDAFAQWCGPCKSMAKNVFTRDDVGKFFNENFINLKLDMETPDGRDFEGLYPVSAYPTLFFIDTKGKVIKKVVGGQQAEGLLRLAKEVLLKNDNSEEMAKEYEGGKRDYDFMLKYIKALNNAGKPSLKIANDYLQSNPELTEEQLLVFQFEAATEADTRLFEGVVARKKEVIKLVGEEAYNEKIKAACKATIQKSIEYDSPELFQEALTKSDKSLTADAAMFRYSSEMSYYQTFHQKDAYLKAADQLAKKADKDDYKTLRFVAEDICKNYKDDPKVVKKAIALAQEAYDIQPNYDNLYFYTRTLLDAGEVDKALKVSTEALEEAKKKQGQEAIQIEGLVKFIQSKKDNG